MLHVHLFNCDNTYKLGPVEDLLNKVAELERHHLNVMKHSFKLAKMSEMVERISTLAMDMAFFVVHAHESRLSINEDNAGIGYAKIYKALLHRAGGNVIIVIGGDDSYEEDGEEDRDFISRWAKRKVSSQFSEENIDGRKSFIFSWNKEHRAVHEAALRHHLNPDMKGETFHYQPPKERQSSESPTPPQVKDIETVHRPEEQSSITVLEVRNAQLKDESELSSSARSPLPEDQRMTEQRLEDISGGRREGFTAHDFETTSGRKSTCYNSQGTTPEKNLWSCDERSKNLAVLGVSLTEHSMKEVEKAFQDTAPKLNLSESPPMKNLQSVSKVKDYLEENRLRFCALVIDADQIESVHEHQPEESRDYQQLLETVVNHVDAHFLVLICGSSYLCKEDEVRVEKVVKDFVNKTEKIVTGWLRGGKINVKLEVLAKLLTATSDVTRRGPNQELQRETNRQVQTQQPLGAMANYPATTEQAHQETVILECELRSGEISQSRLDPSKQTRDYKDVDFICANLLQKYETIPQAFVKVFTDTSGNLRHIVEIKSAEGSDVEVVKILDNETLMLSTLILNGNVSFEDRHVDFHHESFEIPLTIVDDLKSACKGCPKVRLLVVRNKEGQLRYNFITGKLSISDEIYRFFKR